ncbi:MAG TPA: hypothetical protein VIT67_08290 [Povalibacter sp.]
MHAAIDQLLSLRDGEPVDAEVIGHIEGCPTCAAELSRLKRTQQQLQSLELPLPPALAWQQIQARVQAPPPRRGRIAVAVAAAALLVVLSGLLLREEPQEHALIAVQEPAAESDVPAVERLVAQSRELDAVLQRLPERPAVERVAMAATIDSLEQRVQWLDQQLSYAPDSGLNEAQTYQLWRERVDLMDSLVKVRYVEGGSMSF